MSGATIKVGAQGVTGGEAPVQVEIRGPDSRILERLARQVEEIVTNTSGTTNVDTNVNAGKREIQILLDKERLGGGGGGGGPAVGPPRAPATIERKDRQRLALVSASLRGRPLSAVIGDIQAGLRDVALPPGYTATFGGEAQFQTETFGDMLFALALGSLFVFMTIAVQFDSLAITVIIMASVPLASIGTFLIMLVTRTTVSLLSLLGIIMLAGIVVNNAILLVELIVPRPRAAAPPPPTGPPSPAPPPSAAPDGTSPGRRPHRPNRYNGRRARSSADR